MTIRMVPNIISETHGRKITIDTIISENVHESISTISSTCHYTYFLFHNFISCEDGIGNLSSLAFFINSLVP